MKPSFVLSPTGQAVSEPNICADAPRFHCKQVLDHAIRTDIMCTGTFANTLRAVPSRPASPSRIKSRSLFIEGPRGSNAVPSLESWELTQCICDWGDRLQRHDPKVFLRESFLMRKCGVTTTLRGDQQRQARTVSEKKQGQSRIQV